MKHISLSAEQQERICDTVLQRFALYGDVLQISPYGSGHINDTYVIEMRIGGTPIRYLLQRINHEVFTDVPALMDNIERVCRHMQSKLYQQRESDASRRALTLIPSRQQEPFVRDDDGQYWRLYIFIEGALGHDIIQNEQQAFMAASAFAEFQSQLADVPGQRFHETIPGFHHTAQRFTHFESVLMADSCSRAALAAAEIDWALQHASLSKRLLALIDSGDVPERVTHNDTKLNNILIDNKTGEAACIIDLDTVMPGLSLYDFGDLVRTSTSPAAEDEQDLSKVQMQMPMYEALVKGFMTGGRDFLNACEIEHLAIAGQVITYECGIRFLTDYLNGDTYFKTTYAEHNLDRCRTQFALVRSMQSQFDEMRALAHAGI